MAIREMGNNFRHQALVWIYHSTAALSHVLYSMGGRIYHSTLGSLALHDRKP